MNGTNCLTSDCGAVGQSFQHALHKSEWAVAPYWKGGKKLKYSYIKFELGKNVHWNKYCLCWCNVLRHFPSVSYCTWIWNDLKTSEELGSLSLLPGWTSAFSLFSPAALWMKAVTLRGGGQESVWAASGWTGAAVPLQPPCVSPVLYTAGRLVRCGWAQKPKLSAGT